MTDPYRVLCAELVELCTPVDSIPQLAERLQKLNALADRARALLAEPEAEGPTGDEIEEWADACPEAPLEEMDPEVHGWRRCFTAKEFSETIRAVLSRWGRPTPQPVAVSERMPGVEDCTAQGWCWVFYRGFATWTLEPSLGSDGKHTGYTHWLPANSLPTPEATND